MKRTNRGKPDRDLRGRVRRHPVVVEERREVTAKFLDGPLAGSTQVVAKSQDYVRIGPWTYSWCGREGRTPLYAKLPKSRRERALLMFLIGKRGSDPRKDMAEARGKPHVGRTDKRGQGARRRAAKRASS